MLQYLAHLVCVCMCVCVSVSVCECQCACMFTDTNVRACNGTITLCVTRKVSRSESSDSSRTARIPVGTSPSSVGASMSSSCVRARGRGVCVCVCVCGRVWCLCVHGSVRACVHACEHRITRTHLVFQACVLGTPAGWQRPRSDPCQDRHRPHLRILRSATCRMVAVLRIPRSSCHSAARCCCRWRTNDTRRIGCAPV